MLDEEEKGLILLRSQIWVADTAYSLLEELQYSRTCVELYSKAFKTISSIATLQDEEVDLFLTEKQQEAIYKCLQNSLGIGNYPVSGMPFDLSESDLILVGIPGPPGPAGADGADGSDAFIDVVGHPDGNITVVPSIVAGVKTFTIQYTPYVIPAVSILLDDGVIPDPDQFRVVEIGNVIPSLSVTVTLTKGSKPVTASTVISPGVFDPTYQGLLDLAAINTLGSQVIPINAPNVAATALYQVNITDGDNVISDSETITFVYPYLFGNTDTVSTVGLYAALTRLIKTQATQAVLLNAVDDFFWFGLPVEYGLLTQIKDQNGFDVTGAWTLVPAVAVASTGFGANDWVHNYNFYRTTLSTTINGVFQFII